MMAWFLLAYVIMPIYRKTPLYKYLLKRKEAKEKELSKQRYKEYEEERKAEENAFEQIKNHPELKKHKLFLFRNPYTNKNIKYS